VAVATVFLATAVRLIFDSLSRTAAPYATFYLATIVTVTLAGKGPAIACTLLGGLAADYFFVPPLLHFTWWQPENALWAVSYLLVSATLIAAIDAQRKYRVRTEAVLQDLKRHDEALRTSHDRELANATQLEAIMDAMPVAAFISRDAECREMTGNRMAYELLRLSPGSDLSMASRGDGRPAGFRLMKDGREIARHELPLQKAAATGRAIDNDEFDLLFEDGTSRNLIGNAVPLLDGSGGRRGSVGILVDITERNLAEERLRQAQKLESIGVLAGGVAHDFNNLLTVIMGSASAALAERPDCEHSQTILAVSERAAELTRQLLAYAGKGRFAIENLDLTDLVSRSAELLGASVSKRTSFGFHLAKDLPVLKADPGWIAQLLRALVINAGEAIPLDAEGRIEIATGLWQVTPEMARRHSQGFAVHPGPYVCLEVTDNGTGMDEATVSRIFEPFFSTKFPGRGLGLAAVDGIVRSSKGFIEVRSAPGAGTTFRVFLPAFERSREVPAERATASVATVLVADDDEVVRKLVRTTLSRRGYEVLEARDGRDALRVLADYPSLPSVVILDLAMRVASGDEILPILKERYPAVKIVVSSSYPEQVLQEGSQSDSVAAFLQKPYSVTELAKKVGEILK
jgi:signal transduction histidine kinase